MKTLIKVMLIALLGTFILSFSSDCNGDSKESSPPRVESSDSVHNDDQKSFNQMMTSIYPRNDNPRAVLAQFNGSQNNMTSGQTAQANSWIFDGTVIASLIGLVALTIKSDKDNIRRLSESNNKLSDSNDKIADSNERIASMLVKQDEHNRKMMDMQKDIHEQQKEMMLIVKQLSRA